MANPKPKPSPNQAAALSEEARAVLDSAAALDNEALFLLSEIIGRGRARARARVSVRVRVRVRTRRSSSSRR